MLHLRYVIESSNFSFSRTIIDLGCLSCYDKVPESREVSLGFLSIIRSVISLSLGIRTYLSVSLKKQLKTFSI